jgi:hypothetical protein
LSGHLGLKDFSIEIRFASLLAPKVKKCGVFVGHKKKLGRTRTDEDGMEGGLDI